MFLVCPYAIPPYNHYDMGYGPVGCIGNLTEKHNQKHWPNVSYITILVSRADVGPTSGQWALLYGLCVYGTNPNYMHSWPQQRRWQSVISVTRMKGPLKNKVFPPVYFYHIHFESATVPRKALLSRMLNFIAIGLVYACKSRFYGMINLVVTPGSLVGIVAVDALVFYIFGARLYTTIIDICLA